MRRFNKQTAVNDEHSKAKLSEKMPEGWAAWAAANPDKVQRQHERRLRTGM